MEKPSSTICGAKTRRGELCQSRPMPNGRCGCTGAFPCPAARSIQDAHTDFARNTRRKTASACASLPGDPREHEQPPELGHRAEITYDLVRSDYPSTARFAGSSSAPHSGSAGLLSPVGASRATSRLGSARTRASGSIGRRTASRPRCSIPRSTPPREVQYEKRSFEIAVLACPDYGGRLPSIASINDPAGLQILQKPQCGQRADYWQKHQLMPLVYFA
jgi:hypothetical protein